jgi:hypothetical protein
VSIEAALLLASPGIAIGAMTFVKPRLAIIHSRNDSTKPALWLASRAEERAFNHLEKTFPPPHFIISAHMLLADVVGRNELSLLRPSDRAFCWKAHCDFVVVERSTMKIVRAIEVNGSHHRQPIQAIRDRRKASILRQFDIALDILSG